MPMHSLLLFSWKLYKYSLLSVVLINEKPDEKNEIKLFAMSIFYETLKFCCFFRETILTLVAW